MGINNSAPRVALLKEMQEKQLQRASGRRKLPKSVATFAV